MKIFNSLSKKIEPFSPFSRKTVKIYVCGITPYDTTHLGHAFTYLFFDVLVRYLQYKGYTVIYTQNVTDIDDDILKRAKKEKKDWRSLGGYWTNSFLEDLKNLHIQLPTYYVKATDSISYIIKMVIVLQKKGHAYEKDGNVYFDISTFRKYGTLSGFTKSQMIVIANDRGANIYDPRKKNPLDFVLWQQSTLDEPFWESPWGNGRPGWHIECSAMIHQYLGKHIDIHGGGRDLVYPHHESEIAQSESYTNKSPFVKYWMHTAMLMYQGEKMSKSLGNLLMVSDLLKTYSADAIRLTLLSHHYRQPWEFDYEEINQAQEMFLSIKNHLPQRKDMSPLSADTIHMKEFIHHMDNDMDTPKVIEYIKTLLSRTHQKSTDKQALYTILSVLGFSFDEE